MQHLLLCNTSFLVFSISICDRTLFSTFTMAGLGAGRSTSQYNSEVSLGLVGVPHTQEWTQTTAGFEFEFDPSIDPNIEIDAAIDAHLDAFCANPGWPKGQSLNDLQTTQDWALPTSFDTSDLLTYDMIGASSYPEPQNFAYPEPQSYFSAHETPYFKNNYGAFDPSRDTFSAQGLTAIPGSNAFVDYENASYSSQACANPNGSWMLPAEIGSLHKVETSYVPADNGSYNNTSEQFANYPEESQATTMLTNTVGPAPSSLIKQVEQEGHYNSDSGSNKDYRGDEAKPNKASKRAHRKKSRNDSVSSASTSAATPGVPIKYHPGEKPQKVDTKPWIRTNANTEGDTRTAKINRWKNKYEHKPLPLSVWSSGKHTFKYTKYENVDFLNEAPLSTRKIKEYIMNYPCDDQKRLILWIQKTPADQGRRYGSKQHSKCVFKDCPIQRYVEGTISTGEYRVAFDEKHYTYGDSVDPFDCTAYAHLYCMEQFLDFEQVCQAADVRVDTRLDLKFEPNGRAAFSMTDVPARYEMERFVKAARKGKLRQTQRWSNYPFHADYNRDQQKPHERTLTYLAHCMYEAHQDDAHKRQAARRPVTVSQRRVHLGDLEMFVADKRIMLEVYGGKRKGRNASIENHYDERILCNIARAKQEAKVFLDNTYKRKTFAKRRKKRKFVSEETDDEQSAHEFAHGHEPRATRQKKQRVNYAELSVLAQHQNAQDSQSQPVRRALSPEQQIQHLQTYVTTNFSCAPEPSHAQPLIDPTLETPYYVCTVPATPELDISNFPTCEADLPDDNLERLLALERRQSYMGDFNPMRTIKSLARTPGGRMPRSARFTRRAVFQAQPVSDSKEYGVNDPPSLVSTRRSVRLAGKRGS